MRFPSISVALIAIVFAVATEPVYAEESEREFQNACAEVDKIGYTLGGLSKRMGLLPTLEKGGARAVPYFERIFLWDCHWDLVKEERLNVLKSLERINSVQAITPVLIACADENREVRREAFRIFKAIYQGAGKDPLKELRNHWLLDEDWFLRAGAICALAEAAVPSDELARDLSAIAADCSSPRRLGAIRSLGQLASRRGIEPLQAILADAETPLASRLEALGALRYIDGREVPLAAWTLALGAAGDEVLYLATMSGGCHGMMYLKNAGNAAIPALIGALKSPDPQVRGRAAWLLGQLDDPTEDAIAALRESLQDAKWYVAYEASNALHHLDPAHRSQSHFQASNGNRRAAAVALKEENGNYILDNGIVVATIGGKSGTLTSLRKIGDDREMLEGGWYEEYPLQRIPGTKTKTLASARVVRQNADGIEICVTKKIETIHPLPSGHDSPATPAAVSPPLPLEWDLHWILRRGASGIHQYTVYRKPVGTAGQITTSRFIKANRTLFTHPATSDIVQGFVDNNVNILQGRARGIGQASAMLASGRIEAKYSWCAYEQPSSIHGNSGDHVGLWVMYPSKESCYDLPFSSPGTAQNGGIVITHFSGNPAGFGSHYRQLDEHEYLCGPLFLYVNSGENPLEMWVDAKRQQKSEAAAFPYSWINDSAFPLQRCTVRGKALKQSGEPAAGAWAILCHPNPNPSHAWVSHLGPYVYYAIADKDGNYEIRNVRPGRYSLFARIDGVLGEARRDDLVLEPGVTWEADPLSIHPRSQGTLMWELGTPDGTPYEFLGSQDAREFTNWKNNYRRLFPHDVNFTVGESNPAADWYYCQTPDWRDAIDGKVRPVVWKLHFTLKELPPGRPLLTVCSAGTRGGRLSVRLNGNGPMIADIDMQINPRANCPDRGAAYGFDTKELHFDPAQLRVGANTLEFQFQGRFGLPLLYDYLRMEMVRGDSR